MKTAKQEPKIKIELLDTIHTYRVKTPKLSDNQYLLLCRFLERTYLDEDTRAGEEDGYIIIKTEKSSQYTETLLKTLIKEVKEKRLPLSGAIKLDELPSGHKFLIHNDVIVYTKTNHVEHDKIHCTGFEKGSIYLRENYSVYPVETDKYFINHNLIEL